MKKVKMATRMFFVVLLVGFAAGCQMLLNDLQGKPLFDKPIPTHPQEEEVMYDIWKLKIEKANWDTNSLTVVVSATNTGKEPYIMSNALAFKLVSEQGVKYNYTYDYTLQFANFGKGGTSMAPGYNPNQKREDTMVFSDIPKGNYDLLVRNGKLEGVYTTGRVAGVEWSDLFRWKLKQP